MTIPNKTLMIMAGGTGGHVYPAMAVADHLKALGWSIVWLCTEGGMENRILAQKDYQKVVITMRGVRGKGLLGWIILPIKLGVAFSQSYQAIRKFKPNLVLGMGGFAAFPGGVMAKVLSKSLVIHEQNSVAGLTNKVLACIANTVLTAFPDVFLNKWTRSKPIMVGNPVREEITSIPEPESRLKDRSGVLRLLIVGGSLGAQALNEVLPKALAEIEVTKRPHIIHQAGEKHIQSLQNSYQTLGVKVETKSYIEDMAAMYSWADIVICRAGALTIAEISAVGIASVLVPFPYAVDDHQTTNAHYLADAGAAILIPQTKFNVAEVVGLIKSLTRAQCLNMAIKARQLGRPEATVSVAKICMVLAR